MFLFEKLIIKTSFFYKSSTFVDVKDYFVKQDLKGVLKCIGVKIWTTPQTVTDIASNVQLIVYCYKVLQEKLISLWENWKALG